jgi:Carboxypeptidase regulatory-like domain
MKKNRNSESGLSTPRVFFAFMLCSVGALLALVVLAAPTPPSSSAQSAAQSSGTPQAVVINSISNGVSSAVRDMPLAVPTGEREIEADLLRVKPNVQVPAGFVDPAVQTIPGALAAPTPMANFEGQSSVDSGGSAAGCLCTPPDPNGAVGPTQYVQMVNSVFSVYQKTSGTRLSGPTQINSLFQNLPADSRCRIDNNGDPVVVYDQLADRWLVSQFAVGGGSGPTSSECIAISKTPDATGEYYIYDFSLGPIFEDYPHFGLWPDAYYMSTHEFSFASGNAFLGSAAWAFERDKMLVGQPARMVKFKLGSTSNMFFGGHLPSNLDGFTLPPAGSPNYFAEVDAAGDGPPPDGGPTAATLRIWKFHVDWSNPANSTFGSSGNPSSRTSVADFARPNCSATVAGGGCVPQLGDAGELDAIGDRLMYRNAYRNFGDHESLVLNHTVVANATTGQMGPRWYEIRDPGGTPTIFQQSTFGPTSQTDLLYRWMSSIAMDRAGDIAIGYSTSSQINFPSIGYAGRLAGDPVNTLGQGETQLFAGTGPQRNELFIPFSPTGFGRWGDYTDMTVDPLDDCTFWYTNMYYSSTDNVATIWHTRIGSFKFPQCTPRPTGFLRGTVTDSTTSNPITGASVTAGGYTVFTNSSGSYQFSPLAPGAYTVTASGIGYFSNSATNVTVTDGGVTTQNFALVRNQAEPTPTPAPPTVLQTVNPPVLNDPGGTITTNNYTLTWSPAEVTAGLASYVVEESTDYVNPLFDNADGTAPPGQAASLWTSGSTTDPWIVSPQYHNSVPNSYEAPGEDEGFLFGIDTSLTLKNNITVTGTVGSARLNFYSRYFNGVDDTGNIDISTNAGATWTSLRILNDSPIVPPADTRMQSHEIDLSAYKGVPFKIRFRFDGGTTLGVPSTLGWWVDDINVDGATWKQIGTTNSATTSLNITNKPNGQYYYRVRGVYGNGSFTTNSNVQDIIVNTPLTLTGVVSRMTHGSTTPPFNVSLPLTVGTSPRGVECRSSSSLGAGNYTLVFTFARNLTSVASANVTAHDPTSGTGSVSSSMIDSSDPRNYIVNLTGVSSGQYITVTLNNVVDALGHSGNVVSPQMGVLVGDVNASGVVTSGDTNLCKAQALQTVTASNFRNDINASGAITTGDVNIIKQNALSRLPTPP